MKKSHIAILPLALMLAACQGAGIGSGESRAEMNQRALDEVLETMQVSVGEEANSVPNFQINGWKRINDESLVVTAGVHDHYLLTLVAPCYGLDFAFRVAVESRGLNLTRFDDILVNDMHNGLERCRIDRIYKLDDLPDATH